MSDIIRVKDPVNIIHINRMFKYQQISHKNLKGILYNSIPFKGQYITTCDSIMFLKFDPQKCITLKKRYTPSSGIKYPNSSFEAVYKNY